jgi:hypothetical protein
MFPSVARVLWLRIEKLRKRRPYSPKKLATLQDSILYNRVLKHVITKLLVASIADQQYGPKVEEVSPVFRSYGQKTKLFVLFWNGVCHQIIKQLDYGVDLKTGPAFKWHLNLSPDLHCNTD